MLKRVTANFKIWFKSRTVSRKNNNYLPNRKSCQYWLFLIITVSCSGENVVISPSEHTSYFLLPHLKVFFPHTPTDTFLLQLIIESQTVDSVFLKVCWFLFCFFPFLKWSRIKKKNFAWLMRVSINSVYAELNLE